VSHLPELLAELLSETDARDLVDRVGLDARYIEFRGHPVNVWNNVLRAARLEPGKLQALVDSASARYPDHTDELTKAHKAYLRSRPALEQADRYRSAMLEKVRTIWVTGFLQKSLFQETRILLGLSERTDAVVRPMDLLVQRPDHAERPLPPDIRVVDVYDKMDRALLILGAPGSGKTTLLLELARDLLDRAMEHVSYPIPVVFPLSTWAESRRPIAEWLVDELNLRYDVPRKLAQEWVNDKQVLPLLDGLDEVKAEHRDTCVEAINAYRREHGLLPLVVSSRTADYEALTAKLRLQGAVVVQPLSPQQVDSYLTEIGSAGAAVRRAIGHDPMLWAMLDSPLMLNIVTLAYAGQLESQPRLSGTLKERRDHLFGAYVDTMFRRRGVSPYTPLQTVDWLTWLAWQMVRHNQTVLYIEGLQPDWLPGEQRWAFGLVYRLVAGLAVGLVAGLVNGLLSGLRYGPAFGLVGGLSYGLIFGTGAGLLRGPSYEIACAENINWSWLVVSRKDPVFGPGRRVVVGLVVGLFFGLAFSLVVGLVHGILDAGLIIALVVVGLVLGVAIGLAGVLHFLLENRLSVRSIDIRNIPNQGIHRSAWNALVFGLVSGLVGGLVVGPVVGLGVGLIGGLSSGLDIGTSCGIFGALAIGLGAGLSAGGQACVQHLVLRLLLVRNGSAPWDYAKFLDHTAERILLRKVGGGYMFIHRMLLEYFAIRDDELSVETTPNAKPLMISRVIRHIFSGAALFSLILVFLFLMSIASKLSPVQSSVYFVKGNAWYGKGEYDKAIADYDQAIRLNPKYAWAYHNRGYAWYGKGEYDKAIADYDKAIALDGKLAMAYNDRGRAWYAKQEYDKAIADYAKAIELDPKNTWPYNNRGLIWYAKQEYDKAIADYDQAIRLDPKNDAAYHNRGDAWRATGAYDKAIADYDQAIRLDPKYAPSYNNRGLAWYATGAYDKAIADYDQAIRLDPKYAKAYDNRGDAWRAKTEYDKAIADYSEAIRLDPTYATAYNDRGRAWDDKKEYDRAIADYDQAIRLDPKDTWPYNNRGLIWYAKQEYDKAIADYDQAIRLDPKNAKAYINRGRAWYAKQAYDKAIADYAKAIELDPKNTWPYNNRGLRGLIWYATGAYDKAIADYDQAIRLDPKNATAYNNRGDAWAAKQEYDKAIADYDQAIRLDPKNATAYNNRAWLRATCPNERYRDGKRAVESATRACELTDWKEAYLLDTLAAAYAECGDFAHAIEYQEKTQGLYKDEKDRKKGRDRLALYREKKPYRDVPEAK